MRQKKLEEKMNHNVQITKRLNNTPGEFETYKY